MKRRDWLAYAAYAGGASAMALAPTWAMAQDVYPNKPVRVVVPFPAGGVVDLVVRAVTDRLSQTLKQPFVVEAKPGANANIGIETVARAPADGYMLLAFTPNVVTNPLLSPATTRWKTSDFAGVAIVGAPPNVWVVPPSVPAKTLAEFVALAKSKPGAMNVSNPGLGTSNHLGQELFFSATGIKLTDVLYKGQPPMLPDIFSGQLSLGLVTAALAVPHVREGRLRALAISAPKRSPDMPDVPTMAEAGFGDSSFLPAYGFAAAAGTPKAIVKRLSDEVLAALAQPEVVTRLEKMGTQITAGSADDLDALIKREAERWSRVIKERGIKGE